MNHDPHCSCVQCEPHAEDCACFECCVARDADLEHHSAYMNGVI